MVSKIGQPCTSHSCWDWVGLETGFNLTLQCRGNLMTSYRSNRLLTALFVTFWLCLTQHFGYLLFAKYPFRSDFCVSFLLFYASCLSCCLVCSLQPCGHLLGQGWPLGSLVWCFLLFCHFSMWCPGWGEVLGYIDSWSLASTLLCTQKVQT